MNHAGLIAYFFISYSVGLASLVVSLASYLKRRARAARDFFLASLGMASIGASSMVMNIFDPGLLPVVETALGALNRIGAAVFIFVLPLLIHSAYKADGSRRLNAAFIALAGLSGAAYLTLAALGHERAGRSILMGVKDASILYAIVRIALYARRRHDGEMENILHFIMIGSLFVFPFIVVSEFAPAVLRAFLPDEVKGSVSLPLAYLVWSVSYLLSWFRGYIRPKTASEDSYRGFSALFGLSPRETDVVRLLLGGRSYKEIMSSLGISMPTVKSHVSSIYRKTSCNNKMQLSLLFLSADQTKV